jgi:hypothetical protein
MSFKDFSIVFNKANPDVKEGIKGHAFKKSKIS